LLLDEPTNHLDLEMRHALSMALQEFVGAMVIVSHDRHLLKSVTDQLVLVENGNVDAFDGDLDDYAKRLQGSLDRFPDIQQATETYTENTLTKKEIRRAEAEKRKKLQPLKKRVDRLERKIDELNEQRDALDARLADPDLYNEDNTETMTALMQDKAYLVKDIAELEEQWMQAVDDYENTKDANM
jgi:ATP-binding cassette subfamily F protein 3